MPKNSDLGRKILSSKILLVLSVAILIFFSINLFKEFINRQDLTKETDSLQTEINGLQKKNQELSNLINYFQSLDYVEKEARTKLNLRKPGEKIIVVPGSDSSTAPQPQLQPTVDNLAVYSSSDNSNNPSRWWNYFFKIK